MLLKRKAFKNGFKMLMTGTAALVLSILCLFTVYAEDELAPEKPVVVITGQRVGIRETSYTLAELKTIANQDTSPDKHDNNQYLYTARNTYPTKSVARAEGVLLKTLLGKAGITDFTEKICVSDRNMDPDISYLVQFTPEKTQPNTDLEYNSSEAEIEKKISMSLAVPRYCFPNFIAANSETWGSGAEPVEAIIAWARKDGMVNVNNHEITWPVELNPEDEYDKKHYYWDNQVQLMVGQVTSEDMNNPLWNGRIGQLIVYAGDEVEGCVLTAQEINGTWNYAWTRADLLKMNRSNRAYGTTDARGVPVKELLASYGDQTIVTCIDSAGAERVLTKREMVDQNYILAYEVNDGQGAYGAITNQQGDPVVMLYGDDMEEPYQISAINLDLSLVEVYQAACDELDTYLIIEDYKPIHQQEIQAIISDAKAQMALAMTIEELRDIENEAKRKLDTFRTASDLDATDVKKAKITLSKTKYVYSGSAFKPAVTVKLGAATLKKGTDYDVSYSSNKAIGKATVKITGTGDYWGSVTKTFTIIPGKAVINKLTAGKSKLTVYRKSLGGGVSYQVQIRPAGGKWKTYSFGKKTSKTITKLKKKKYSVRVRAYKKVGTKTYYGSWSAIKTVKVK